MTIVDGKITLATVEELYKYYLARDFGQIYSFPHFKQGMINAGCIIEGETERDEKKSNK